MITPLNDVMLLTSLNYSYLERKIHLIKPAAFHNLYFMQWQHDKPNIRLAIYLDHRDEEFHFSQFLPLCEIFKTPHPTLDRDMLLILSLSRQILIPSLEW